MLSAGAEAPEFRLKDLSGELHSRSEICGGKQVLLAFYKVSCPTCQYTRRREMGLTPRYQNSMSAIG